MIKQVMLEIITCYIISHALNIPVNRWKISFLDNSVEISMLIKNSFHLLLCNFLHHIHKVWSKHIFIPTFYSQEIKKDYLIKPLFHILQVSNKGLSVDFFALMYSYFYLNTLLLPIKWQRASQLSKTRNHICSFDNLLCLNIISYKTIVINSSWIISSSSHHLTSSRN